MSDEINSAMVPKRRPTPPIFLYSHQQYKLMKDAQIKIDTEAKKQIANRWKALSSEDKQPFKDKAMNESNEVVKDTGLRGAKPKKNYMQVRISLNTIVNIIRRLNPKQRDAVKLIGLGGILELKCTHKYHDICARLVSKFDPQNCSLNIHGQQQTLTTGDVKRILGINDGGYSVEIDGPTEGFSKLCFQLGVENGSIKLSLLRDYLTGTDDANDEFKRKFALYILGSFLCPTTMPAISQYFVHVVKDVSSMKNFNWAKLTLDRLVDGIHNCQKKGHLNATGCILLLMLFYLDRVAPIASSYDVIGHPTPTLADWGDEQINWALQRYQASGSYENHEANVCGITKEDDGKTDIKEILRAMARDIGDIKHLLVRLVSIHSPTTKKSKAKRMTSSSIPKGNSINETEASSPAPIKKAEGVVLSSTTEKPTKLSPPQSASIIFLDPKGQTAGLPRKSPVNGQLGRPQKHEGNNKKGSKRKLSPPQSASVIVLDSNRQTTGMPRKSPVNGQLGRPQKHEVNKKQGSKRKLNVDDDNELDLADARANQLLGNLDVLSKVLGRSSHPKAPPSPKYVEPQPLSEIDDLLVGYCFRTDSSSSRDTVVTMTLNNVDLEFAKRYTICSLQAQTWIDAEIINIVAIQLTNEQRKAYPDGCHTAWFLPTYICQRIIHIKPYQGKIEALSADYCRPDRYTGQYHACQEVYVPMNDGTHWFCLKLNMVLQQVYLFDSKPATKANSERRALATRVVEQLQEIFKISFGHFHQANLTEFEWLDLEYQPLQAPSDSYDCGLFVIKFMQGVPLPHGVFKFHDLERKRLLVDIMRHPNNSSWNEFSANFAEYTERLLLSVTMDAN